MKHPFLLQIHQEHFLSPLYSYLEYQRGLLNITTSDIQG